MLLRAAFVLLGRLSVGKYIFASELYFLDYDKLVI